MCTDFIFQKLNKYQVIDPENVYLLIWESLQVVIINLFMLLIMIDTFISTPSWIFDQEDSILILPLCIPCIILQYIDNFFIQFNVGYYQDIKLITDHRLIFKRYFKFMFWIDLISVSILLFNIIMGPQVYNYTLFIYFLKFFNLSDYSDKILKVLQLRRNWRAFYKILRIFLYLNFFYVILGILFYQAGIYAHQNHQETWLLNNVYNNNVLVRPKLVRFEYSFYWSVQTGINAYGEFTGQNPLEVLISTIAMTFGGMFYSIFVVLLWEIILEKDEGSIKFQKLSYAINRFMRNKKIDIEFNRKINQYLYYSWRNDRYRDYEQEAESMQKLSYELRSDLIYQAYESFFKKIPWMTQFSEEFKRNLSTCVKEEFYSESEFIFEGNFPEIQDQSIYFIEKGQVELFYNVPQYNQGRGLSCTILNQTQIFGEWSLITGQSNLVSARAKGYVVLYKIPRHTFLECLQNYPKDKEIFQQLSDNVIFKTNANVVNNQCFLCEEYDHHYNECTLIKGAIAKELGLDSSIILKKKKRTFNRKKKKSLNALKAKDKFYQSKQTTMSKESSKDSYEQFSNIPYLQINDKKTDQFVGISINDQEPPQLSSQNNLIIEDDPQRIVSLDNQSLSGKSEKQEVNQVQQQQQQQMQEQSFILDQKSMAQCQSFLGLDKFYFQHLPLSNMLYNYNSNGKQYTGSQANIAFQNFYDLFEFDKMQAFKYYKCQDNQKVVIKNYNRMRKKKLLKKYGYQSMIGFPQSNDDEDMIIEMANEEKKDNK